jgi:hypothetical protein
MMNTVGLIVSIVVVLIVILLIFLTRENFPKIEQKIETVQTVGKVDDLTKVEGIGPKIQSLLESVGIKTYGDLAQADVEKLRKIMLEHNLRIADPTTWPKQGKMLSEGRLDELKKYQDTLKGGRMV